MYPMNEQMVRVG